MQAIRSPKWHVCPALCADGSCHAGITTDVADRVREHNADRGAGRRDTRAPSKLYGSPPLRDPIITPTS